MIPSLCQYFVGRARGWKRVSWTNQWGIWRSSATWPLSGEQSTSVPSHCGTRKCWLWKEWRNQGGSLGRGGEYKVQVQVFLLKVINRNEKQIWVWGSFMKPTVLNLLATFSQNPRHLEKSIPPPSLSLPCPHPGVTFILWTREWYDVKRMNDFF